MSPFAAFLQSLLFAGDAHLTGQPVFQAVDASEARSLLQKAFGIYRLNIAGPAIVFEKTTALAAAECVWHACWFLLHHGEPDEEVWRRVRMPVRPSRADQHLSADLMLRFLPKIYQRAQALCPEDPLCDCLVTVLREWPLSGVLSEITEPPLTPLDLDHHPGLMLLYAERLASHPRSDWFPEGQPLEYVEMVFTQQGKEASTWQRHRNALMESTGEENDE
jgi:hypothetical protein